MTYSFATVMEIGKDDGIPSHIICRRSQAESALHVLLLTHMQLECHLNQE